MKTSIGNFLFHTVLSALVLLALLIIWLAGISFMEALAHRTGFHFAVVRLMARQGSGIWVVLFLTAAVSLLINFWRGDKKILFSTTLWWMVLNVGVILIMSSVLVNLTGQSWAENVRNFSPLMSAVVCWPTATLLWVHQENLGTRSAK